MGDGSGWRPRDGVPAVALSVGALLLCLGATVVILASPRLLLGGREPALHLVLDTADACVALLVAYLLLGRFRREASARALLLGCGLLLLAAASVAGVVPTPQRFTLEVWFPHAIRVLGALAVAAAAVAGARTAGPRLAHSVVLGAVLVPASILLGLWVLQDSLPAALTSIPVSASSPAVTGHPALIVGHVIGAAGFLLAAVVFTLDARRSGDEMLRWLGPACVLGAFSRFHYTLFPSIYSGWLYTGDVLRTGCYLLLLVGAAREISRFWATQPRLAVVADRRRLARELHDGVLQDLGYIKAQARTIDDPAARERIERAARRGLDEARSAVEALVHGDDDTLSLQLHRTARQLSEQYGVPVIVDLDVSVQVAADQAHALVRIAREAVTNAARHGRPHTIGIGLSRDREGPRLVVHDDGNGFDTGTAAGNGRYGLISMRDRAAALPGELTVRSASGRGTTVVVTW